MPAGYTAINLLAGQRLRFAILVLGCARYALSLEKIKSE
ncbi:Uncharacterised protein [Yersinia rohdei]|nr:Uncharacterised protein [Yersinia rohdei]